MRLASNVLENIHCSAARSRAAYVPRRLGHLAAIHLVLLFSAISVVKAETLSYFTTGYGRLPCSAYLTASQGMKPNDKNEMRLKHVFVSENAQYDHWIFGFVSAMNYRSALDGQTHPDIVASNAEILGWVQSWCGKNPTNTVIESVEHFIDERWSMAGVPPQGDSQAPSPPAAPAPMFVSVVFQPNLPSDDVTALLQAYKVTIAEGPDASGFYKLRLSDPLAPDQLQQFIESMRSQTKVVRTVVSD